MHRPHPLDTAILALLMLGAWLILRVFFTEAYVIPTGSMAPTLLGVHRRAECPHCGHSFALENEDATPHLHCPGCRARFPTPAQPQGGDRVLVDKTVVHPRRFDVMVFLNPQVRGPREQGSPPGPLTTFVKRVAGLPGEDLYLLDGNLYARRGAGAAFRIVRKTDPAARSDWQALSESLLRPVWRQRGADPFPWRTEGEWIFAADGWTTGAGALRFDFAAARDPDEREGGRPAFDAATLLPYDQCRLSAVHAPDEDIEEISLGAQVLPNGPRSSIRLSTQARLDGPQADILALQWRNDQLTLLAGERPLASAALSMERGHHLALWFVDGEALALVDGACVLRHPFDPPWDGGPASVLERPAPARFPVPAVEIEGGARVQALALDADLNWMARSGQGPARGGLMRDAERRVIRVPPVVLPDGALGAEPCYFMLGDNSAFSTDSRYWNSVHPWVVRQSLQGEERLGLVPQRLMCGRVVGVPWPGGGWPGQWRSVR